MKSIHALQWQAFINIKSTRPNGSAARKVMRTMMTMACCVDFEVRKATIVL